MSTARTADLWWKNAIVYCLDVETFRDSNGDGCGDFTGLTERLDYLAGLGVTCLWLMPFYPSPNRDDGYDIVHYYNVDTALGSLGDFVVFMRTAKDRGLRVIVDLVVNHTSDQHPWFQSARSDPTSPYRDFYVWRDQPPDEPGADIVFPDAEDSIWNYDDQAGQYYLHHFYSHQPDVNIANPAVREEIAKVAGFWLELGVDGFRVDAVPYLFESRDFGDDIPLDPHGLLKDLRAFITRRKGDAALLGEVNLPTPRLRHYFGDRGDQIQLLFDFPVMQAMYLALAREDATALREAVQRGADGTDESQWAIFARNHDELTLDQLTDDERQEVFAAFGPDEDMQLFGRGLRRRLPPMLDGDEDRLRMVYSLVFSLPGTPVLFYGEEIGMGENLSIDGRESVRTPMQWDDGPNGGFSDAEPQRLRRPVTEGSFGPREVNVADQQRDPGSLLHWFERLIRRRRETPELGWGVLQILDTDDDAVMAHRCDWEGRAVLALHNLSAQPRQVRVPVGRVRSVVDLLAEQPAEHDHDGDTLRFELPGYGHRWLRLVADSS
ncbi:MAG TPA: alpha-amylase family protein [Egibacteraceae bacterium]|nr:alpha-amylase family protein [Egibacteraceae bacterium]